MTEPSPARRERVSFFSVNALFTAYDQQKLRALALAAGPTENYAVIGALALYLDFINLFLFLLRIFGSRRN